jgi:hypothetical protein
MTAKSKRVVIQKGMEHYTIIGYVNLCDLGSDGYLDGERYEVGSGITRESIRKLVDTPDLEVEIRLDPDRITP